MSNRAFSLAALTLGAALVATPALALPGRIGQGPASLIPSGGHLVAGRVTVPPRAAVVFCETYSDQCIAQGDQEPVVLTAERWAELTEINRDVNARIRPHDDAPGTDVWTLDADAGDCDDYAVEKRKELIDRGWPSAALLLSVAFIPDGQAHLVVTVRTDHGDLVLDNMRQAVISVDRTGYRWLAQQSTTHPALWTMINGISRAPVLVAAPALKPTIVPAAVRAPSVAAATDDLGLAVNPATGSMRLVVDDGLFLRRIGGE